MKISLIMCISKILTDLYAIKQKIKKNIFANVVYNALVVKKFDRTQRKLLSNDWQTKCKVRKRLKFMLILSVF